MNGKVRSLAAVGGLVVSGAALAACGGGAGASAGATATTTTTVAEPTTTTTITPTTTTEAAPTTTTTITPTTSPTAAAGPELIVRSADGAVDYAGREPSSIGFSGDATNIVSHLTWSSWGPDAAVGHGLLGLDNCVPNCAQGTVTQVPATIGLGSPTGGHFTTMTEKAGTLSQTYTYPSKWATSAS